MTDSRAPRARRVFRPPQGAVLLTPLLMAAMVALGFWQLDRAAQKQRILADFEAAAAAPAERLEAPAPAAEPAPRRVALEGRYRSGAQLLLDSQIRDGEAGLRVWTPLQRPGGGIVLVDRGWIADPGRDTTPDIAVDEAQRSVRGLWRPFPEAGLEVENAICDASGVQRVQYPRHEELACRFDAPLAEGLLLLDAEAGDGFRRDWQPGHLDPRVHWAYALQWFAFAAALLVIFFVVNRKAA